MSNDATRNCTLNKLGRQTVQLKSAVKMLRPRPITKNNSLLFFRRSFPKKEIGSPFAWTSNLKISANSQCIYDRCAQSTTSIVSSALLHHMSRSPSLWFGLFVKWCPTASSIFLDESDEMIHDDRSVCRDSLMRTRGGTFKLSLRLTFRGRRTKMEECQMITRVTTPATRQTNGLPI